MFDFNKKISSLVLGTAILFSSIVSYASDNEYGVIMKISNATGSSWNLSTAGKDATISGYPCSGEQGGCLSQNFGLANPMGTGGGSYKGWSGSSSGGTVCQCAGWQVTFTNPNNSSQSTTFNCGIQEMAGVTGFCSYASGDKSLNVSSVSAGSDFDLNMILSFTLENAAAKKPKK